MAHTANIKIRIKNEVHSKQVQDLLFEMGFEWRMEKHGMYRHVGAPFLMIPLNGNIQQTSFHSIFDNSDLKEVFVAHPKQIDFLRLRVFDNIHKSAKTVMKKIIETGFYYKENRNFLNNVLNK